MKMQKKKIKYHHLKIIIIKKKNEYIFHRNRKRV